MRTATRLFALSIAFAIAIAMTSAYGADLTIHKRQADGVTILDLKGKLTGDGAAALLDAVRGLLDEGLAKIVLNFRNVGDFDPEEAFGKLVAAHKAVRGKEGQLKFCGLSESLKEQLAIDKFLTVFDVYDTEKEALDTFTP